jgi:hypothetical protein
MMLKFESLIKKDLVLFTIDCELEEALNKGNVPEELKKKMGETEGILFSKNITTKKNEDEWVIIDEEKKTTYIVRKENEKLNIYLKHSNERETLKVNVRGINRRPIGNKIGALLKQYKLEQYNPEIKKLNAFRNLNNINWNNTIRKLKNLMPFGMMLFMLTPHLMISMRQ